MNTDADFELGVNDRSGAVGGSIAYVNEAGVPESVMDRVRGNRDIANAIEKWSQSLSASSEQGASYDFFSRNKWQGARHTFAVMSKCAWAVENDDILSTLVDVIEGQTFTKNRFELFDEDQQDMWNQWAGEVDLDSRLREMFRELFKVSTVYVGMWWEQRVFTVRDAPIKAAMKDLKAELLAKRAEAMGQEPPAATGPGRGNRARRKKFPVQVPTAFTIFDPTKIMPVGSMMFGRERFAYIANKEEAAAFDAALKGDVADSTVIQLIERRYSPTGADKVACAEVGVDSELLFLFKETALFRHSLTKSQYERFAPVRLKSVLPILEMKDHLRASDRASLIGNTNFIVVIKKGSDRMPAKAAELENLREQAKVVARLPLLIGDHRLSVEIVSPALDNTLIESRWQVLDSRLVFRSLNTFTPLVQGGNSSGAGVSEMSRLVSRGLESRRHMLVRTLEAKVFKMILERNSGVLSESPGMVFIPRRITLDIDQDIVQAMLKLRDRGDISRETTLEELDFDQEIEVQRRAKERLTYDEVFESQTPYGSPKTNPYGADDEEDPNAKPPVDTSPEGGRPPGVAETNPRKAKGAVKA